ncbi:MAG TPA: hypothetical protein VEC36_06550 [Patescibacteria group bacterium]|nr:hypothetical protein [Patescibacteria group bacterium]
MNSLAASGREIFVLSDTLPFSMMSNNYAKNSSEKQNQKRITAGKPSRPSTTIFLVSNRKFMKGQCAWLRGSISI